MAADRARAARERRPAVWPWLVMPIVVLLVFYALFRVHQRPGSAPAAPDTQAAAPARSETAQP
jgi:hypothetical protein